MRCGFHGFFASMKCSQCALAWGSQPVVLALRRRLGRQPFFFRAVVNMSVGALGLPGRTSGPHMANVSCVLSAAWVSLAPEGYQQGTGAFACVGFLGLHHVGR